MEVFIILALVFFGQVWSAPHGSVTGGTSIDLSGLTACEKNMQLKCVNVYGTEPLLRGTGGTHCDVKKLVDCMKAEKVKRECVDNDRGTVYYIDAFLRNIDPAKCMDDFDFSEVQNLFQTLNVKNIHEYSNVHRTFTSGEHTSSIGGVKNGVEDDEDYGSSESGSGAA